MSLHIHHLDASRPACPESDGLRETSDHVFTVVTIEAAQVPDASSWFGIPFEDLDCRHWLPALTEVELGQTNQKLTIRPTTEAFPTNWTLSAREVA